MKRRILALALLSSLIVFGFNACKKKDTAVADLLDTDSQTTAVDGSYADKTYNDAFDLSSDAMQKSGSLYKTDAYQTALLNDCATLTWDSDTIKWPKKVTITFNDPNSTLGCLGKDGRYRKGKIHISLDKGHFTQKGSQCIITLDGYEVDGNKVEGTKTVTNQGTNAAGHQLYSVEVTNGKITKTDGKIITWQSSRTREVAYTGSSKTIAWCEISGSGSGIDGNGHSYVIDITKALHLEPGCRWITSGTINITPQGKLVRTIDYGTGACDRLATISVAGKTYQFEMK